MTEQMKEHLLKVGKGCDEYEILPRPSEMLMMGVEHFIRKLWHDGCEIPVGGKNILMIRKDEKDSNYPPIAGCFHGTNSRLDGKNWGYYNGFCYNEIEPPVRWAYIDDLFKF